MKELARTRARLRCPAIGRGAVRAFTLTETVVATAILCLVSGVIVALLASASRGLQHAASRDDAFRSTQLALGRIRSDLSQMVLVDPSCDLAVQEDGRGFSFRVPTRDPGGSTATGLAVEPVAYGLEPVRSDPALYRLVRRTSRSVAVVPGCLLESLTARVVSRGEVSGGQTFLEITVVGRSTAQGASRWAASTLCPLTLASPPEPYETE